MKSIIAPGDKPAFAAMLRARLRERGYAENDLQSVIGLSIHRAVAILSGAITVSPDERATVDAFLGGEVQP